MRLGLLTALLVVATTGHVLAQDRLEPTPADEQSEPPAQSEPPVDASELSENQLEVAVTFGPIGKDWSVHDHPVGGFDAERMPWFTAGVEVRGVLARTWVIGLAGEVSYAKTGGCSSWCFFGDCCSPVRERIPRTADLFGALRIELVRSRVFALATEVGLGPSLGGLGEAFLGGGRAHLRLVFQARQFIGMVGARARLMASTEPGVQLEASLAGVVSVGVVF